MFFGLHAPIAAVAAIGAGRPKGANMRPASYKTDSPARQARRGLGKCEVAPARQAHIGLTRVCEELVAIEWIDD